DGINGFDLGVQMSRQAEKYGAETVYADVTTVQRADGRFLLATSEGELLARSLILTGGADYNRLGVPGEERLTGRGVSYCATCDAAFFKGQDVAVVGGGDAAMDEGLFTSRYADNVTVVHRRDELRASRILQERAFANPKMKIRWNTVVDEVVGDGQVTSLRLRDVVTGDESTLPVGAVFIFIGQH